jgi:CRP-like cAMP-binding protein
VLHQVALATRGVLADPPPHVRTHTYAAWSIEYEVRFFLEDFARQQEIVDEFKTQVWYAAKRNGLVIPFPIQTSYEYRMALPPPPPPGAPTRDALAKVPVFVPLGADELELLSRDAVRQQYGHGEFVVRQGDPGDALFVILEGTAIVSVRDEQGAVREVARLSRGEFFGEMALLTGEPRTASVTAADDLSVLVIFKETMQGMLARRPPLASEIAEIVAARRSGLRAIQELRSAPQEQREQVQRGAGEVLQRIVRFFGL